MGLGQRYSQGGSDKTPSFADKIKNSISTMLGRRESPGKSKTENPYLTARRTWNEHVGSLVAREQTWQLIGIMSLLISFAAVGGLVYVAGQSKFIPYVVEVDKSGRAVAVGPVQTASKTDFRVIHATVAEFITDARTVTADVALQRKIIFRAYAKLAANDPATAKMNEWLGSTPEASPFQRARKELVSINIRTVLPQTQETWQVEWDETARDRQGIPINTVAWRAIVTVYIAEPTSQTTDEQIRNNPMGIYVRDFAWARIQ